MSVDKRIYNLRVGAKKIIPFSFVLAVFSIFLIPHPAAASCWYDPTCWIAYSLAALLALVVGFIGALAAAVVWIIVAVSQYNGFISSDVVVQGWNIVRDIANMFFVLVLLIISFGTILHVQQYQMKSLLPKVILMAILVNFSKAIAGIFIDFAQVIMLTFVAAYSEVGPGNFLGTLGLKDIVSIRATNLTGLESAVSAPTTAIQRFDIVIAYLLAILYGLVALVVLIAFLLILVVRIVMLWILVVFSPMAYVLSVVPAGQKYAQQWWDMFSKYLIIGPIMAFFLWLSLATLPNLVKDEKFIPQSAEGQSAVIVQQPQVGPTVAGGADQLARFAVGVAMLIMSLIFAQQVGGAAGKIAGNAYGKITTAGSRMAMWPIRGAQNIATGAATSDMVMNRLARYSRIPVLGRLATRAYSSLRGPQQKAEDDAEREVKRAVHLDVLASWANRLAISPYERARQSAAKKRAPSRIRDDGEFEKYFSRMPKEDIRKLSNSELFRVVRRLGMARVGINSSFQSILTDPGSTEERGIVQGALGGLPAFIPAITAAGHPMPAPTPYAIPTNIDTRYRAFTEVDTLKLAATQQKIKDAGSDAKKFYASDEYKNNSDQYLSEEEYNEHQREQEAARRLQPAVSAGALRAGTVLVQGEQVHVGGAMAIPFPKNSLDKVSGAQSLLARGARDGYARMAIDFQKLRDAGLRGDVRGANIGAAEKQKVIGSLDKGTGQWSGIMGALQKEGAYSDRELEKIHNDLTNAKGITLLNKGAGDARGTIAHEAIHDRLNVVDPAELRKMWDSLSKPDKENAEKEIKKQWGDNLSDSEVMHEYFAEGLTKASQYGDKSNIKVELPPGLLDKFAALGVVTKKTVTSGKGEEKTESQVYNPTNMYRKKTVLAETAAPTPKPPVPETLHEEMLEEVPEVGAEAEQEVSQMRAESGGERATVAPTGQETPALSRYLFGMDPIMRKAFRDLTFQMYELAKSQRVSGLKLNELTSHIDKLASRAVSERPVNPLAARAHDEEILSELKQIGQSFEKGGGTTADSAEHKPI